MEKKKLTGVIELIKNSFRIYFKSENLAYLVKVLLVMYLALGLSLVPFMIVYVGGSFFQVLSGGQPGDFPVLLIVLFGVLAFLVFLIASLLMSTVFITAVSQVVKGEIISVKETIKKGWSRIWKFLGTSLLAGIIATFGYILLIIPGIIFSIWFSFATFVVVVEGKGVIESLKESKALVSGYFWPVLGRLIVFGILAFVIQLVVGFIPFAGPVIAVLLAPYYLLLPYLLYEDLKRVRS